MSTRTSRISQAALVVVLILALAVPGIALAKPQAKNLRAKASKAAEKATGFNQPQANMEKRINNVLAARAKRFAAADANIQKRIDRLRSIATSLASEGASPTLVAAATAKIESAQQNLDMASSNESDTVGPAFKKMLTEENKRAAFFEAKKAGRESVAYLKAARKDVKEAARLLRGIVQSMKPTEDADGDGS